MVFPMDMTDCASTKPSHPSEILALPPLKKQKKELICGARLSCNTMWTFIMHNDDDHCYNAPEWKSITHLFFSCIVVNSEGEAIFGNCFAQNYNIEHPTTYISFLQTLKKCHPHLKIYMSMPPLKNLGLSTSFFEKFKEPFWRSLEAIKKKYKFDGVELNFELLETLPQDIVDSVACYLYRDTLMLTLPNQFEKLREYAPTIDTIYKLQSLVEALVFNCFGYAEADCDLREFMMNYRQLDDIDDSKVLMGIDTCGIREDGIAKSLIPYQAIHRQCLEKDIYYPVRTSWAYYAACADVENWSKYVYDDPESVNVKLNWVRDRGMAGCVLGDLMQDLPVVHEKSLLRALNK